MATNESVTYPARTWKFDRTSSLPPGEWNDEPDKLQWVDAATGLDCLILRNRLGALCGYVGVAPDHPWHGKSYNECLAQCGEDWCHRHSPEGTVDVHGGLTFASACSESHGDDTICHVPYPGRAADVWWFGFDCAHSCDFIPGMDLSFAGSQYRSVGYVQGECASLAFQLAEASR